MNNQVDKEKIEELASIYLKSLENELINLQQFIAGIKVTESIVESDKRIAFIT